MPERDASFPRDRRLRKRREFDLVMGRAPGAGDGTMVVHALPRTRPGPSRLGLVVGRRLGKAVLRNRIKRRLRAAFRTSAALADGVELVVVARSGNLAEMPFGELRRRLERLAARSLARGKGPGRC